MVIDWFTVCAQILNFLILAALLKAFLYKPVLEAIDAREQHIMQLVTHAEQQTAAAERERAEFEQKNQEFLSQRSELLRQATEEIRTQRAQQLEEVRRESTAMRDTLADKLRDEQSKLHSDLIRRTQSEVLAIARKALQDLANQDLQDKITEQFLQRLRDLLHREEDTLAAQRQELPHTVRIKSVFPLTAPHQQEIADLIRTAASRDVDVEYTLDPELLGGIELSWNGYKVEWNIREYLSQIERQISQNSV